MLLLTGPPGSGKTRLALDRIVESATYQTEEACLLTPTATMAEHLRNELARAGLVIRASHVRTTYRFVSGFIEANREVTRPVLVGLVRDAIQRVAPAAFHDAANLPGLHRRLAELIDELSAASCSSAGLWRLVGSGGLTSDYAEAIAAIHGDVEASLRERGLLTRGERLRAAALRIAEDGLGRLRHVLFDGFFSFTGSELRLIEAVARHADVTVTLPRWEGAEVARERLLAAGFQERTLTAKRPEPERVVMEAPNQAREAEEIARRIIHLQATGRPFREMGIVVRAASSPCVPLLRTTMERFGIPARFYFGEPLRFHHAVRRVIKLVDAFLGGWEMETLRELVRLWPDPGAADWADCRLTESLPEHGLEAFLRRARGTPLEHFADSIAELETWRAEELPPTEWSRRTGGLAGLFPPPDVRDGATHEQMNVWRAEAEARRGFHRAMEAVAPAFPSAEPVSFARFWEGARAVLDEEALRIPDGRRNVVHVIDAYEARQWEIPVVFVCGLLEKEFPRHHSEDPLLGDAARRQLRRHGIWLRTSQDWEQEEEFLFRLAMTRATSLLTLSYPARDEKGDQTLPSFLLQEERRGSSRIPEQNEAAVPVLAPARWSPPPARLPRIQAEDLHAALRRRTESLPPTAIEAYLQCPFLFFGDRTLDLDPPPPEPEDRLDGLVQGIVLHRVLALAPNAAEPIEEIFERFFEEERLKRRVPESYRTEAIRAEMRESLRNWRDFGGLPPAERSDQEREFVLSLGEGLSVTGRLDRLDVLPGGRALVIDYKYTRPGNLAKIVRETEDGLRVQAGLYLLAARQQFGYAPAGMLYCALKRETDWKGWLADTGGISATEREDTPQVLSALIELAANRSRAAAEAIRAGRIDPEPADESHCDHCDFRDVCRVDEIRAARAAGGGVS